MPPEVCRPLHRLERWSWPAQGVLALKIGVDEIEADWSAHDCRIFVTDPEGVIFMSIDPGWLYCGLLPLGPDRLERLAATRRCSGAELVELQSATSTTGEVARMRLADGLGSPREHILTESDRPRAGWTARVLLDTAPIRAQAWLAVMAFALFLLVGLLLASTGWPRLPATCETSPASRTSR